MIRPRLFITAKQNARNMKYNVSASIKHSELRHSEVVDEFYYEECKPSEDNMKSVAHVDPIYMLFNQQRINNLGEMGVKSFLDSLQQNEDSLATLRKKVSDDDLITMVKSRHLQSPSEITAWCRYIQSNIDEFNNEYKRLVESQQQQQQVNIETSVEPQTSE